MIGTTRVPAGEYTLFSLPTADAWTLVISKRIHEWGTEYDRSGSPPDARHDAAESDRAVHDHRRLTRPHVVCVGYSRRSGDATSGPGMTAPRAGGRNGPGWTDRARCHIPREPV
jgi:hypothetical protein